MRAIDELGDDVRDAVTCVALADKTLMTLSFLDPSRNGF
jgi:hypothetical protein